MTDPTNYPEILQEIAEPAIRASREGKPATTLRPEDALCLCAAAAMIRSLAADVATLKALLREVEWIDTGADPALIGCHFCDRWKIDDHTDDCRLKAALEP